MINSDFEFLFDNAPLPYVVLGEDLSIDKYNIEASKTFKLPSLKSSKTCISSFISSNDEKDKLNNWISTKEFENNPIVLFFQTKANRIQRFKVRAKYSQELKNMYIISLSNVEKEYLEMEDIIKIDKEILQEEKDSKITAVEEMFGNIAHQWRQPLNIISSHTAKMRFFEEIDDTVDHSSFKKYTKNVEDQIAYLSQTIEDFLSFFKQDTNNKTTFNLYDTLSKIEHLLCESLDTNFIKLETNLENIFIQNNETILIQALLNIINNAKDAIVENIQDILNRHIIITLEKVENNAIIIIKDSGGGISDTIKEKIFEPYFTTKDSSKGTGIGLNMVKQVINKQFSGKIEVNTVKYEHDYKSLIGAEFKITLPTNI